MRRNSIFRLEHYIRYVPKLFLICAILLEGKEACLFLEILGAHKSLVLWIQGPQHPPCCSMQVLQI